MIVAALTVSHFFVAMAAVTATAGAVAAIAQAYQATVEARKSADETQYVIVTDDDEEETEGE